MIFLTSGVTLASTNIPYAKVIVSGLGITYGGISIGLLVKYFRQHKWMTDICPHCGKSVKQTPVSDYRTPARVKVN